MEIDDEEDASDQALKQRQIELRKEFAAVYRKLPLDQRVQVERDSQEFDRMLRHLAQSKGYYQGDKQEGERLARNGKRWFWAALIFFAGWEFAQWFDILDLKEPNEWLFVAIVGASALAGLIEYFGTLNRLAFSARQYSRDEADFFALGVRPWNVSEFPAALQHLNEHLEDDKEQYSYELKELHYDNLKLGWKISMVEGRLETLGIDWC